MHTWLTTTRLPGRRGPATRSVALLAGGVLALLAGAVPGMAATRLKLPAERTSSTGNFFTLQAYDPATTAHPVANFDMKVCTSAHTPRDTAIDPAFFTVRLTHGTAVTESITSAKSPALTFQPLAADHCAQGWLGFRVPKGDSVASLVYTYKGSISWEVG